MIGMQKNKIKTKLYNAGTCLLLETRPYLPDNLSAQRYKYYLEERTVVHMLAMSLGYKLKNSSIRLLTLTQSFRLSHYVSHLVVELEKLTEE